MRISTPITVSALVVAGLVATGSATNITDAATPARAPEALLAASSTSGGSSNVADNHGEAQLSRTVGLLPVAPEAPRKLTAMTPPADGNAPLTGSVPLRDIALPATGGALGIPEIVLAAYRNAELALESSMPGCGVSWNLLAGIGRIESGHASGGRTDAAGTSINPIFGPSLDGTLPGNEVIKASDGGWVRAVGPMQFLPGTWNNYAADGNGDGVSDPHNVFDATLAAGKYLCAGGLNLRDQAQELRAVLRYNNSMSYAANVLSWSAAYRTGGTPSQVSIAADLIPPGRAPIQASQEMLAANTTTATPTPTTAAELPPNTRTSVDPVAPTQVMITIPGLPPIPCGIFCPPPAPPANPCQVQSIPAPMPRPGDPARPPGTQGLNFGASDTDTPVEGRQPSQACVPAPPNVVERQAPAPAPAPEPEPQPQPSTTTEAGPPEAAEPAPQAAPTPTQQPAITLPFNIVIPLPPLN